MPRFRIPRRLALVALPVLAVSCDPIVACGCEPSPAEAIVYGTVTGPAGAAVPGAQVRVQTGPPACQSSFDEMQASTGAGGAYRLLAYDYRGGPDGCRRVFALPPAGSSLRGSDTVALTVLFRSGGRPDSMRVDLALRNP